MATIKFDANDQAILINNFSTGCDEMISKSKQLIRLIESLEGYETKHKAQLIEKLEDAKRRISKSIEVIEAEKKIVEQKRAYLIASEAINPFANIQVDAMKATTADLC